MQISEEYNGHCLKRTLASLLVNCAGDMLKEQVGSTFDRFTNMAERYQSSSFKIYEYWKEHQSERMKYSFCYSCTNVTVGIYNKYLVFFCIGCWFFSSYCD